MDINPNGSTSSANYIVGRKKYSRPQAMLWSNEIGSVSENGIRYPEGIEKEDFIICSDHNRSPIEISKQRIENRQRMVNGTMRSYHIADKANISVSWDGLPSRSFSKLVNFNSDGKPIVFDQYGQSNQQYYGQNGLGTSQTNSVEYTADGGAGGVELLDWYENHSGPFYVFLSYDKYNNATQGGQITSESFNYLDRYVDIKLMYFSSFNYTISKRGPNTHDFWNVSVELEEV